MINLYNSSLLLLHHRQGRERVQSGSDAHRCAGVRGQNQDWPLLLAQNKETRSEGEEADFGGGRGRRRWPRRGAHLCIQIGK